MEGMSKTRRCPADLPAAPGDEHGLLELCPRLPAQCNVCRGISSAIPAPLLCRLVLSFQVADLGQQKGAENSDQASLLEGCCVFYLQVMAPWSQKSSFRWLGLERERGTERQQQHCSQEDTWLQGLYHLTHLHLEQLFPVSVPPEPVQLDQCLSPHPGSLQGRCGHMVQLDIQGIAVLIQGPGLEGKQRLIP